VIGVKIQIVRFADDAQPGWVECRLIDVHGRAWSFVEKAPVVSEAPLDATTVYPQPGVIACQVLDRTGGVARIDTGQPWDIASVEGQRQFDVPGDLLVEW
jgi:hypothetical protein